MREREREREREGRKRRSDMGEREKITNTKKFMEFYLVVLQSGYPSKNGSIGRLFVTPPAF